MYDVHIGKDCILSQGLVNHRYLVVQLFRCMHPPPVGGLPEFSLSQKLRQDLTSIDPTMLLVIQLKTMSDDYERGLAILESLISGKKRQDGSKWEHAFDMMHDYLEVCDYSSLFWHDIASE